MRVAVAVAASVLVAAAALAGCRGGEEQPEVQKFEPVGTVVRDVQPKAPASGSSEVIVHKSVDAPEEAPRPPVSSDIAVGMSRDDLMALMGDCAERIAFTPTDGRGSLTAETFQPKLGACVEKFHPRRVFVIGGVVKSVEPGVDEFAAKAVEHPVAPVESGPGGRGL